MARDTKLRMSIDQKIIDKMDELRPKILEATEHKPNSYELRHITLPCQDDSKDVITFAFTSWDWQIYRNTNSKDLYIKQDEDCWTVKKDSGDISITTYGKMTTDINREILELLDQVEVEIALIEDPIYCPVCGHCGETGCCGYIGFLEKHVRGKTDCIYEKQILDDLIDWIKEEEND